MNFLNIFLIFVVVAQSNAMTIQCEYSVYEQDYWPSLGGGFQCRAAIDYLRGYDSSSPIEAVTQNNWNGRINGDVDAFWMDEQNLESFPKGLEKFFPKLKAISLSGNKITSTSKDDLKVFSQLHYISYWDNKLTTLDDGLFSLSPTIQYVELGKNQIKHIGLNTFKPLKNLQVLDFAVGNNCIDENAGKRDEVKYLTAKLYAFCPPINKETFSLEDREQIENRFKSIEDNIKGVENKIDSLKLKIDYLVKKIENNEIF